MSKIPCFLCIQELTQRTDKNRKPYFVCDPCGVQIFIRGRQGIKNLSELIATLKEKDFAFRKYTDTLYEIQGVLTEIRGIEKEIDELKSVFDIVIPDERKDRTRELLKQRIETLLGRLELIAKGRSQG
jgi:chaperonin cofactor prefoldin